MGSNVEVRVTADTADLAAKFAVAKAETAAFTSELNKLAREAATTGNFEAMREKMDAVAANMLTARTRMAELRNELQNSTSSFSAFDAAANLARTALGAFGLAASAGGFITMAKNIIESTAQLENQSRVIGVSVEALQAYHAAAVLSGAGADVADTAIRRFTRAIGDAQAGVKGQADALAKLGVSGEALYSGTESLLTQVASALLDISDKSERARLEFELFGRSGQQVELVLRKLADPEIISHMHELGLTMDRELVERAEAADKAWSRFLLHLKVTSAEVLLDDKWAPKWADDLVTWIDKFDSTIPKGAANLPFSPSAADLAGIEEYAKHAKAARAGIPYDINKATTPVGITPNPIETQKEFDRYVEAQARAAEQATRKAEAEARKQEEITRGVAEAGLNTWQRTSLERISGEEKTNDYLLRMGKESIDEWEKNAQQLETARYYIEVGGAQSRANINQTDVVAATRAMGEIEIQEQEHQNKLTALVEKANEDRYEADRAAEKRADAARTAENNEAFAAYRQSSQLILEAARNDAREIEEINRHEFAQKMEEIREIESLESGFLRNILSGRMTFGNALLAMMGDFIERELIVEIRGMTERMMLGTEELAAHRELGQHGLLYHMFFEQAKTAATVGESAIQVAAKAEAAAEGMAVDAAIGHTSIINDAYQAAAGAFKAVAGIPIVGPILAPVAAAAAFAGVMAFDVIKSFDTGTPYVPYDQLAMVHKGEAIIPASQNTGDMGGQVTLHVTVQSLDPRQAYQVFKDNAASLAKIVSTHMRFNPSTRPAF